MADIRFTFSGDTSNLDKSIDESISTIKRLGKESSASAKDINKAFAKLGKDLVKSAGADKALESIKQKMSEQKAEIDRLTPRWKELNKAIEDMNGNTVSAEQYKQIQEFQALESQLSSLNEEYAQYETVLQGAEKQSKMLSISVGGVAYEGASARAVQKLMNDELTRLRVAGKEGTQQYRELSEAAGNLADVTGDIRQQTQALASDTVALDATLGGLQTAAGAYSSLTGALEMFGVSGDNVAESQKRLQSAIAITTGLQSVANQFQKQSSVMQGILLMQEKARTKALAKLAAANGKATLSQKLFNAVAKANPYVILATALITVVGALAAFAFGSGNAAKQEAKAAAKAKAWSDELKTIIDSEAMLMEKRQKAAQHAVDMANAEGKSKREVLELQKQQLAIEQEIADAANYTTIGNEKIKAQWIEELDKNKKELGDLRKKLAQANSDKAAGKKYGEEGKKLNDDYFNALNDRISSLETYVEIGEKAIETEWQMGLTAATLAEQERQLAIEEAKASQQAQRTTQDLETQLMTDEKAKQRKKVSVDYDRQIQDLKTQLTTEKNLTETQREEMNKQIILLEKNKNRDLENLRRQDLNDQLSTAREVQAKMRDLAKESMDQELNETLDGIKKRAELEKQARLDELQEQKETWIKEQGGLIDKNGKYSDETKLTKEQKSYLEEASKNITQIYGDGVSVLGKMIENEIYNKYSSAFQKAVKDQQRYEADIVTLKNNGFDTGEAITQRNNAALEYMQNVEGGLTPQFKAWIDSLGNYTLQSLQNMLKGAEEQLTVLRAYGAPEAWIIEAEARIAALNKEIKTAQNDIQRGPKLTAYKNLNKILGDSANAFAELGKTGNEAFDNIMKGVGDIVNSAQTVIANMQTLVENTIQAEEMAAKEGASAVKAVEKASVILAIIGAVIGLVMKLKNLADREDPLAKFNESVKNLAESFKDLRVQMDMALPEDSIFGENTSKRLQHNISNLQKYREEYQKAIDEAVFGSKQAKSESTGVFAGPVTSYDSRISSIKSLDGIFGEGASENFEQLRMQADDYGKSLKDLARNLMDYKVQTQHSTWFRDASYDSIGNLLDDYNLVGETEEETFQNLKKFAESGGKLWEKIDEPVKELVTDTLRNYEAQQEALEGMKEIYSGFFGNMTNSFADAIKNGFTDGAKAGRQNFKEQVNGMVSDFYLQMRLGERVAEMEDSYTQKMLDAKDSKEQQNIALTYADELNKMYDEELSAYNDLQSRLEERGYGLKDALNGTLSGAIKGASQESIDLLSGYTNAVRINQVDSIGIMREQLISLSGIEGNTRAINGSIKAFHSSMENIMRTDSIRAVGAN